MLRRAPRSRAPVSFGATASRRSATASARWKVSFQGPSLRMGNRVADGNP